MKVSLYTDGGVVGSNPSSIGGTVAFYIIGQKNEVLSNYSSFLHPNFMGSDKVTNNQTELWALLLGLAHLKPDQIAHVYCDSEISLGRVFKNYAMANIPKFMFYVLMHIKRMENFKKLEYTLLSGHPTKRQLELGTGKGGRPVSEWNVNCDRDCNLRSVDKKVKFYDKGITAARS